VEVISTWEVSGEVPSPRDSELEHAVVVVTLDRVVAGATPESDVGVEAELGVIGDDEVAELESGMARKVVLSTEVFLEADGVVSSSMDMEDGPARHSGCSAGTTASASGVEGPRGGVAVMSTSWFMHTCGRWGTGGARRSSSTSRVSKEEPP
jgi:hypothetical protein